MSRDYFSILGLSPARYEPAEITRRFRVERARVLAVLHDPAKHGQSRRRLDELHVAYAGLRDPLRQAAYLRNLKTSDDRVAHLSRLISDSLEDGLLRYSRREEILGEGRQLGFSDFQTQLLIAQVQFGSDDVLPVANPGAGRRWNARPAVGPRFAAVGVLTLALFLAMVRWLGA
jgi:hypothetical protein